MFKSRLPVEYAIAGTAKVQVPDLLKDPPIYDERNVYLDPDIPKFDYAIKAIGQSAEEAGINNNDIVLCRDVSGVNFVPDPGFVVVLTAANCQTTSEVHPNWKCIRRVEAISGPDRVDVVAGHGDELLREAVNRSDIIGHAVYAFSLPPA